MRKLTWLSGMATVLMLISTRDTQGTCYASKTRQKYNANAPSDMPLDILDRDLPPLSVGSFVPWVCAVFLKQPSESAAHLCEAALSTFAAFISESDVLVKNRELKFHRPFDTLHQQAILALKIILQKVSLTSQQTEAIQTMFSKINHYRLLMERAIFSQHQQTISCDEHAARTYVDELVRAKNGDWPKKMLKKLHLITLHSHDEQKSHVFMVAGSNTLLSGNYLHNVTAVKNILGNLKGTIIDYWNHPEAGGVRMRADKAREQYNMYGARASVAWDSIKIEELLIHEIHDDIEKMKVPEVIKACLLHYAGPRVEEIQQGLPPLAERLFIMLDHAA